MGCILTPQSHIKKLLLSTKRPKTTTKSLYMDILSPPQFSNHISFFSNNIRQHIVDVFHQPLPHFLLLCHKPFLFKFTSNIVDIGTSGLLVRKKVRWKNSWVVIIVLALQREVLHYSGICRIWLVVVHDKAHKLILSLLLPLYCLRKMQHALYKLKVDIKIVIRQMIFHLSCFILINSKRVVK